MPADKVSPVPIPSKYVELDGFGSMRDAIMKTHAIASNNHSIILIFN